MSVKIEIKSYEKGFTDGKNEGYSKGENEGYSKGYKEGINKSSKTICDIYNKYVTKIEDIKNENILIPIGDIQPFFAVISLFKKIYDNIDDTDFENESNKYYLKFAIKELENLYKNEIYEKVKSLCEDSKK